MRTHYDNLHVSEKASPEVIKGAYKALAQKWHPDKHPDQREKAERYFKIITRAFEVLSDPKARAEYDVWLAEHRAAAESPPDIEPASEPPAPKHAQSNMAEAWDDGKRSREQGFTEKDCPYSGDLAGAWQQGFKAGPATDSADGFHPWRRFFARFIDIPLVFLATMMVILLLAKGLELLTAKDFSSIHNSGAAFLLLAIATIIAYETFFIESFSATPGKWILGITVTSNTGERLSNGKAILRAFYANAIGQGLHIPLLAAAANIAGLIILRKTGSTYWDDKAESVVHCKPMSTMRAFSAVLAVVVAIVLYSLIIDAIGRRFQ